MDQTLHLLIVDREAGQACATLRGGRWILPMLRAPERARPGPLVAAWATSRGLTGQMVGQWLGRGTPSCDEVDWLIVLCARNLVGSEMACLPLHTIAAAPSWIDYQTWAAHSVLAGRDPRTVGPFGTVTWIDEVLAWVSRVTSLRLRDEPIVAPARATPREISLAIPTEQGRVYLKGAACDLAAELVAQLEAARRCPDAFPRTLAVDVRTDGSLLWLIDECPGVPLAGTLCADAVARSVRALASVQQRLSAGLVCSDRAVLDVDSLIGWADECAGEHGAASEETSWSGLRDTWDRLCDVAPNAWIPADLDPSNVLIAEDGVRFIDSGESLWGPAPLALAGLARRVAASGAWEPDMLERYERAWSPSLQVRPYWPALECVSMLVECRLSWARVVACHEREVHGLLGPVQVRLARRIRRALAELERQSR